MDESSVAGWDEDCGAVDVAGVSNHSLDRTEEEKNHNYNHNNSGADHHRAANHDNNHYHHHNHHNHYNYNYNNYDYDHHHYNHDHNYHNHNNHRGADHYSGAGARDCRSARLGSATRYCPYTPLVRGIWSLVNMGCSLVTPLLA